MHIEPGFIVQSKVLAANVAVIGVMAVYAKNLIVQPKELLKTLGAAVFFCFFMQVYHMPVGPSELHFLGAIPLYLLFGFTPALFGFALGLLFQGLIFTPTDLAHLSVNSLSLILPLIAMHKLAGHKLNGFKKDIAYLDLLRLDGLFYTGVTLMVGFWLLGESVTNLAAWGAFAASYLPVVFLEASLSLGVLRLIKGFPNLMVFKGAAFRLGLR